MSLVIVSTYNHILYWMQIIDFRNTKNFGMKRGQRSLCQKITKIKIIAKM